MLKIPMKILIIDDEVEFVEMLTMRLTDEGHRVRAAFDGDEGLAALEEASMRRGDSRHQNAEDGRHHGVERNQTTPSSG